MTEQIQITLIDDPIFAETMAYTEKPYQDLAIAALEQGLPDEVEQLREKADIASIKAGIAQVAPSMVALLTLEARSAAKLAERTAGGELAFLPEVAPEDVLPAPKLGKNSEAVVARAAATIATLPPDRQYVNAIHEDSGLALGTILKIVEGLTESGFLVDMGKVSSSKGGPKHNLYKVTEEFNRHLARVPEWRNAYNMRVLGERLGRDEAGTMDYLRELGMASVLGSSAYGIEVK